MFRIPIAKGENKLQTLTANDRAVTSAHELIAEQAARTPEKIAVQCERSNFVIYRDLDRCADATAERLRLLLHRRSDGCFCQPGLDDVPSRPGPAEDGQQLVPICFDKGIDTVVAILAVLKVGACYVPHDPAYPADVCERSLSKCLKMEDPLRLVTLLDRRIVNWWTSRLTLSSKWYLWNLNVNILEPSDAMMLVTSVRRE